MNGNIKWEKQEEKRNNVELSIEQKIEIVDKGGFRYNISRMRFTDIDEIMKIEKASFQKPWRREQFEEELLIPFSYFFVLRGNMKERKSEEVLLAYGGFWKVLDEAHILNFAVHPKYRKQGIGTIFLKELINRMKLQDCKACYLEVRASNVIAQRLYENLGFKKVEIRKDYYGYPKEDAIIYRKEL